MFESVSNIYLKIWQFEYMFGTKLRIRYSRPSAGYETPRCKEQQMSAVGMDFGFDLPRPHLRLTKRGRTVLTTLAAIPLIIAAAMVGLNGGGATATQDVAVAGGDYEYVTVEAGQSLWALATDIAPAADPRDVVEDILAFNGMSTAQIFPGQQLALPDQYATK